MESKSCKVMNEELFEEWEKSCITVNELSESTSFENECENDNQITTDFLNCQLIIGMALSLSVGSGIAIYNYLF